MLNCFYGGKQLMAFVPQTCGIRLERERALDILARSGKSLQSGSAAGQLHAFNPQADR